MIWLWITVGFFVLCTLAVLAIVLIEHWQSEAYINGYMDAMDDMEASREAKTVNRILGP